VHIHTKPVATPTTTPPKNEAASVATDDHSPKGPPEGGKAKPAVDNFERNPLATAVSLAVNPRIQNLATPLLLTRSDLALLDSMWTSGQKPALIDTVRTYANRLRDIDVAALPAADLVRLLSDVTILRQRSIDLMNGVSMVVAPEKLKLLVEAQQTVADVLTKLFRRSDDLDKLSIATPVEAWVVYKDTQKEVGFWSAAEHETYFVEKLFKFIGKGGNPDDIHIIDKALIDSMKSGDTVEYVVDAYDVGRAALEQKGKPSPGHTVLSNGADALTAGSFTVHRAQDGTLSQIVIGTFSGHFRTGVEPQEHLVRHLVAAGVPEDRIVRHEDFSGFPRTGELLSRVLNLDPNDDKLLSDARAVLAGAWSNAPSKPPAPNINIPVKTDLPQSMAVRQGLTSVALRAAIQRTEQPTLLHTKPDHQLRQEVVAAFQASLRATGAAGNTAAHERTLAVLDRLIKNPNTPEMTRLSLRVVEDEWVQTGASTIEPVDLLSPPVGDRKTRFAVAVADTTTAKTIARLIDAGASMFRYESSDDRVAALVQQSGATGWVRYSDTDVDDPSRWRTADWVSLPTNDPLKLAFIRQQIANTAGNKMPKMMWAIVDNNYAAHLSVMASIADGIFIDVDALRVKDMTMQLGKIQDDLSEAARLHGKPLVVGGGLLAGSIKQKEPLAGEMSSLFDVVKGNAADGILLTTEAVRPKDAIVALELLGEIVDTAEADAQAELVAIAVPGANGADGIR
jgi:hypothetical protein